MKIRQRNENGELGDFINAPGVTPAPSAEEQIKVLDERTVGMQAIDDFTLQAQATIDDRTLGMQAIDDFTLEMVTDLQTQVAQLQAEINILKGGA